MKAANLEGADKGRSSSMDGKRIFPQSRNNVSFQSQTSESINCSSINTENRFLILRNFKKEAMKMWEIGKELGLKSEEKDEVMI